MQKNHVLMCKNAYFELVTNGTVIWCEHFLDEAQEPPGSQMLGIFGWIKILAIYN